MTGLSLSRVLRDFPDIEVNKIEVLTNIGRSHKDGVRIIPALVAGDKKLSGVVLGKKKIRNFLESLSSRSAFEPTSTA